MTAIGDEVLKLETDISGFLTQSDFCFLCLLLLYALSCCQRIQPLSLWPPIRSDCCAVTASSADRQIGRPAG